MRKIIFIVIAVLFAGTNLLAQQCTRPVVTTFAPTTGYIGSTVTISGSNFDPVAANNQVFFGATQATVLSSSFSTLVVTVPVGTTYAPISVRNACGLIGSSTLSFNGIFCPTQIDATTYNRLTYSTNVSGGYQMLSQDMDLDGKPDLLVCGFGTNQVSIMRNLSTPGVFNFATKFDIAFSGATRCIAPADFDGDGKVDIAVVDNGISGVKVYRNTSTPGSLSFTGPYSLSGIGGYQCAAGDLNNDGKLDLVVGDGNSVKTFRNTSTNGNISFVANVVANNNGFPTGLVVADIDGDGVKDIGTTCGSNDFATALRNTTTPGSTTFSFANVQTFSTGGSYPYRLFTGDFDKDGKIDFTTCNFNSGSTGVLRNTSTQGSISFTAPLVLPSPSSNYRIGVGDADGDGNPDIVTKSSGENKFSVYRNTSSGPGAMSFATRVDYYGEAEVSGILIADLDGNYVPDIATSGISYNTLRVYSNNSTVTDATPPTAICKNIIVPLDPTGNAVITASMVDNGSSDACGIQSLTIDKSNFTCANLGANNVVLTVRDRAGNTTTCTAVVTIVQAAIIVSGQSTVCQGQTVPLKANLGDSYQWYKDGVLINGATARDYVATETGSYTVAVTNSGGCSGTSLPTQVTVSPVPVVTTTLSGSPNICQGNSLTITASSGAAYQWSNGITTQSITVAAAGTFAVTVFDANGCSATSAPVTVSIKAGGIPTAAITTTGNTSLCQGETVLLTASAAAAYEWSNGETTQAITVGQSGSYTVKVINAQECFAVSAPVVVNVKAKPSVNAGQDVVTCNQPVQLNAVGNANGAPVASVITKLCLFDAPGGSGNCTFTDNLCNDGYQFMTNNSFTQVSNASAANALKFKLYYTPCTNTTVFTFKVNGNVIGSYTETVQTCTCTPGSAGQYPRSFDFTPAQFMPFWNSTNNSITVEVTSTNSGVAVAGITAEVSTAGEAYVWTPATGLSNATIANPIATPTETTVYTVTYTTGNGCSATDDVKVTVRCNTAPVAACKPIVVSADSNCQGTATAADFNNGSSDADGDALTFSVFPAGPYAIGTTTVTLTVTDTKGESTSCTTTITVVDDTKPTIIRPGAIRVSNDAGKCTAAIDLGTPVTADNCGIASVTNNAPAVFPVGTTIVTWTVTDIHNNVNDTCKQTVVVVDNELPVISTVGINVNNDQGKCGAAVAVGMPVTSDNCGVATVVGTRNDGKALSDDYPVGTTLIQWVVTDTHDNTNTSVQTIVVKDTEKPVIACSGNKVFCANTGGNTNYTVPVLTQGDNCGIFSTNFVVSGATNRTGTGTDASGSFLVGTSTVTYTVKDIHGNESTCSFTVTINPLPVATIAASNADAFCNQLTLTGSSTLNGPFGFAWSVNGGNAGTTPAINLGLTNPDGIYSLYTTDVNGCRSEFPATYDYRKQNLASSYTILAFEEVKLGQYNKVVNGSVGVMTAKGEAEFKKYSSVAGAGSFVKAPKIEKDGQGINILNSIYGVATVTLPTMQLNTSVTKNLSNYTVGSNVTISLNGNFRELTLKKGANVTLSGNTFGTIKLEEGASVKFESSTLNIEELKIEKGPKTGYSYIRFAPATSVRVSKSVTIGNDVIVNPENHKVTFYLGDVKCDEEKFHVKGDDTRITANIYIPKGKLKVTGGNYGDDKKCSHKSHTEKDCEHKGHGHKYCDHKGHNEKDCEDDVIMTGLFIAEEVESEGKSVTWNNYDCSAPVIPFISTSTENKATAMVESSKPQVGESDLQVTVMPNPSAVQFTLKLQSKYSTPVHMRVTDATGRTIDSRANLGANSTVTVGSNYLSGTYYAEFTQGNQRKVVQLIKVRR